MGPSIVFLDTSCLVAMVAQESDGPSIAARLQAATGAITAPHVLVEGVMVLTTIQRLQPLEVLRSIEHFLDEANVTIVPITTDIARAAVDAFSRYGKGRGHPAKLNFGDCLSYACAKTHGVSLLFKGDDFAQTDLATG